MKFEWNGQTWYIDKYLALQLISLAYNIKKDWDYVIMITGDRMVRVGKSVLGMTICAYLAYLMNHFKLNNDAFTIDDIYFDNKIMVDRAQNKPKYTINLYDEGREGLAAVKAMKGFQQDLMDFFTECGQLNQVFVIVAPDFFELKEDIAVARSEILINVYRKGTQIMSDVFKNGEKLPVVRFDRGYFEFFSRKRKAWLYDKFKSQRRKNYGLVKADFVGRFVEQYPLGESEYKQLKKDALSRFKEKHKKERLSPKVGVKVKNLTRKMGELLEVMSAKELGDVSERVGKSRGYFSMTLKRAIEDKEGLFEDKDLENQEKDGTGVVVNATTARNLGSSYHEGVNDGDNKPQE